MEEKMNGLMKGILALGAVAVVGYFGWTSVQNQKTSEPVTAAAEAKFFRIGTGGAGGTYFPIGGLIANAISSPPGARSCEKGGTCGVPGLVAIAVSTNASVFNMNAVQAGNLEAGLAGGQSVAQG
jgi:TRAP-type uncharacterized transport system substrate-binding protein